MGINQSVMSRGLIFFDSCPHITFTRNWKTVFCKKKAAVA
jgi:hypothetical protein